MSDLVLPKKVLLIDDDNAVAEALDAPLRKHGIALVRAADLDTALYTFNQQIFEVAVVELEFAPLNGLALVQKFRSHKSAERRQIGVIIASGQQRKATDDGLANEIGDVEFCNKPLNAIKLLPLLGRAVIRRRSLAEYDDVRTVCYDLAKKTPKDLNPAIDYLKPKMPKLPPKKGPALMLSLYEEAGKLQEALGICEQMLAKSPEDIVALNAKGRLLLKLGQFAEAKSWLERADKVAPHNIERVAAMADMYLQLRDPVKGVAKMKEMLALSPEEKDLKFDLFKQLAAFGFEEQSLDFCRETTPPTEVVRYYNNKGVALAKTGSPDQAVAEYQSALKVYPAFKENYRVLFNVALAEAMQKQPENLDRAVAALHKCLELHPKFEKAESLLALLQKALKRAG